MPKGSKLKPRARSRTAKSNGMRCILCKKVIRGKPRVMMLQITSKEPRFTEKAQKLGFTSDNWRLGESMKGNFHRDCFDRAALLWEVAFETRAVSPRR